MPDYAKSNPAMLYLVSVHSKVISQTMPKTIHQSVFYFMSVHSKAISLLSDQKNKIIIYILISKLYIYIYKTSVLYKISFTLLHAVKPYPIFINSDFMAAKKDIHPQ